MIDGPEVLLLDHDDRRRGHVRKQLMRREIWVETFTDAWTFLDSDLIDTARCAVLDVSAPNFGGLETLERLSLAGLGDLRAILIGPDDVAMTTRAMKLGARDYVPETAPDSRIVNAVWQQLHEARQRQLEQDRHRRKDSRLAGLTPQEMNTLVLLSQGKKGPEVARALNISKFTFNFHSKNLKDKLGARNQTDLVRIAHEAGLGAEAKEV